MSEREPEFDGFIRCWDEGRFFEAHEVLEGLWMRTRDERQRGLIQLAAALYHIQRGNLKGARTMIDRALPRLEAQPSEPVPVPVAALAVYAKSVRDAIGSEERASLIERRPRLDPAG